MSAGAGPWRQRWLVFATCAVAVLAALGWVTREMLHLEAAERRARPRAAHEADVRLALWRMESWLAPHLAREAARPWFEYQAYAPLDRAYTRLLHRIERGDVLTASPLLGHESPYLRLHFQLEPDGTLGSPQVPTGNLRDLAESGDLDVRRIEDRAASLAELHGIISVPRLHAAVAASAGGAWVDEAEEPGGIEARGDPRTAAAAEKERRAAAQRRKEYAQKAVEPVQVAGAVLEVGPFAPLWCGEASPELLFVRRVTIEGTVFLQGFLCDWPALDEALRGQIADLFPAATLRPVTPEAPGPGGDAPRLATVPVALDVPPPTTEAAALLTPSRGVLAVAWVTVVAGLLAVAITLRRSARDAERRGRFASAVTHELRTPLTTFRMYAEMLERDMVSEADRRRYLATLREEADRLGARVENVLAYARLERGRTAIRREAMSLGALLDRVAPTLERSADRAGMVLRVERGGRPTSGADPTGGEADLLVDPEAIEQILLNLVDNAGKYAVAAEDRSIHLDASVHDGRLRLSVRDHGPGIPAARARAVFTAFERGERGESAAQDPTPGVGLGLALARGLARRLGGDLRYDPPERGARFVLDCPSR